MDRPSRPTEFNIPSDIREAMKELRKMLCEVRQLLQTSIVNPHPYGLWIGVPNWPKAHYKSLCLSNWYQRMAFTRPIIGGWLEHNPELDKEGRFRDRLEFVVDKVEDWFYGFDGTSDDGGRSKCEEGIEVMEQTGLLLATIEHWQREILPALSANGDAWDRITADGEVVAISKPGLKPTEKKNARDMSRKDAGGFELCRACLLTHHNFSRAGCDYDGIRLDAMSLADMAKQCNVSKATASRFFARTFKSYAMYSNACKNEHRLMTFLAKLQFDLPENLRSIVADRIADATLDRNDD